MPKIDWNGYVPHLEALRAAKEAEAQLATMPELVKPLESYYVDHLGHTFRIQQDTYVYEGQKPNDH